MKQCINYTSLLYSTYVTVFCLRCVTSTIHTKYAQKWHFTTKMRENGKKNDSRQKTSVSGVAALLRQHRWQMTVSTGPECHRVSTAFCGLPHHFPEIASIGLLPWVTPLKQLSICLLVQQQYHLSNDVAIFDYLFWMKTHTKNMYH